MTVRQLAMKLELDAVVLPDGDREVTGVYCCDLLSWVMGRAASGDAWITIMSNINIVAVASLVDVSCVILAEGVTIDDEVISVAKNKGINILNTPLSCYEIATAISDII